MLNKGVGAPINVTDSWSVFFLQLRLREILDNSSHGSILDYYPSQDF